MWQVYKQADDENGWSERLSSAFSSGELKTELYIHIHITVGISRVQGYSFRICIYNIKLYLFLYRLPFHEKISFNSTFF